MGKKGYNWRARSNHATLIDNTETNQIAVELPTKEYGGDDVSNTLVLPSKKRPTKVKNDALKNVKILSKVQRKKLEKIVEKKQKKENRAALLEALSKVQIGAEELKRMTSISETQSKGLKKNIQTIEIPQVAAGIVYPESSSTQYKKIKTVAGASKRKRLLLLDADVDEKKPKKDPNVVGFDESSSGDSECEEEKLVKKEEESLQTIVNDDPAEEKESSDVEFVPETTDNEKIVEVEEEKVSNKTEKKKDETVKMKLKRETIFVQVDRDPKIQAARLKLPILAEEQAVVECINENAIVLIVGETGSGKTTQVPQFLYEAGYANDEKLIGITEPRRVAAVAMSDRVATEMNLTSKEVSYLMRYEGNVTENTRIKFMTDGVLLKEIETDFVLSKYSVIIIDEAHERSVFTDILIGLLSRIVPLRCKRGDPLRLIIMSATLRVEDFTENTRLFRHPPPTVKIEARQYPVTVHFNKRTHQDYLKAAFSKAVKIHTKLPDGGILIFVTGQQEVHTLVKKLRNAFSKTTTSVKSSKQKIVNKETDSPSHSDRESDEEDEYEMMRTLKKSRRILKERRKEEEETIKLPKIQLDDFDIPDDEIIDDRLDNDGEDSDVLEDSEEENEWTQLASEGLAFSDKPLWVLPLYSMLPPAEQGKVFKEPPEGHRLCIVATNVAETSLTIPNIKYVIDTGKQKIRIYEKITGASAMRVVWISHASAEQRAGRAGRSGPGHCYRLYSSAVYQHDMPKTQEPDIRMRPVDDLFLQMKCMGIDKIVNFPFPTAPEIMQLKTAEMRLEILGALEKSTVKKNTTDALKVTPLGKAISGYPVLPRYGKMLALSHQYDLFQYTICMVAALSVQEVLINRKKKWTAVGEELLLGDPGALLSIVGASEHAALAGQNMETWCASQGVRERALKEIRMLRGQLSGGNKSCTPPAPSKPPGPLARPLRQILLAGLGDCVARKIPLEEIKQNVDKIKFKYAYQIPDMEEPVFIHSGSVLRKVAPEWVVYQEMYEAGEGDDKKMIIRGITAIDPEWLPVYVPKLCNMGEPLTDPPPRYDTKKDVIMCHVKATFGRSGWPLPVVETVFPKTPDAYRWFAIFFLDGSVCPKLQKYVKSLLSPPQTMIKSWAKLQARTDLLHRSLIVNDVCSKSRLLEEWKKNPMFLLDVYKKWLPESAHDDVAVIWPPRD